MTKKDIQELKDRYRKGLRITLQEMKGEPQMERGLEGRVDYVDDIGQIHMNWENGSSLALSPLEDRFTLHEDKLRVIFVQPEREAKVIEMDDTLEALQEKVQGYIEEYMPFEDDVAIICNEEGKNRRLPLNRAVMDSEGKIIDIIAGNFLICHAPAYSDRLHSLPEGLEQKYIEKFRYPEYFMRRKGKVSVIRYRPVRETDMER